MTNTNIGSTNTEEPSYSFRPSVLGAPRNFRLSSHALEWDIGRRTGRVGFERVTRVRLSYRPATLQNYRFVTEIWSSDGPRLDIVSSSWKSMVEQIRLDKEYRSFIGALHRKIVAAGSTAQFVTGTNPAIYWVGLALFVAAAVGMAALIVRAIEAKAGGGAAMIAVFLGLFLWQASNFFRRNRPGRYSPDGLPPELLPAARD